MSYQPILDIARAVVAGFQVVAGTEAGLSPGRIIHPAARRFVTADTLASSLAAGASLPANTFLSIPVPLRLIGEPLVKGILREHGDLGGVVLDITDFSSKAVALAEAPLEEYRRAGALISVGGRDARPELSSIVRLRPSIIRLGREWIRDLDAHPRRRSAIEETGRLAGQLDAWILADGVTTAAELRALARLEVPLARGPFIGEAHPEWTQIDTSVSAALPIDSPRVSDGVLRALLQEAYITTDPPTVRSVPSGVSDLDTIVVIDERRRPVSLLELSAPDRWEAIDITTVNVDTPAADAAARAMARPQPARFTPLLCTDAAGRFVGILRVERLLKHLES